MLIYQFNSQKLQHFSKFKNNELYCNHKVKTYDGFKIESMFHSSFNEKTKMLKTPLEVLFSEFWDTHNKEFCQNFEQLIRGNFIIQMHLKQLFKNICIEFSCIK